MNTPAFRNWQSVQKEVLRRIHARQWQPGALIPNEADLALEFGCARATVNRALRSLADMGLLDRRRKAGTRVALQPVAKATLDIPVIRAEIEGFGQTYGYQKIARDVCTPPVGVRVAMQTDAASLLHLQALHIADGRSYAFEDRWINLAAAPAASEERFDTISGNEWLLRHTPYTHGDIAFSAAPASALEASLMGCQEGAALFVIDRLTWDHNTAITKVRLVFAPGHQMRTRL